ncbi:MAG TPA: nuclease-related domain-containing protein [Acidimicrobiales bacterium]
MGSRGIAGESAREGYQHARGRRRRKDGLRVTLAAGVVAAGWLVYRMAAGERRLVIEGSLALLLVGVLLWRGDSDTKRWLRGAGGEVATASVLEELPPKRWEIFHDLAVPGSKANIDHLAIGPTGVWVIDSKTTRAPVRIGVLSVRFGERRLETDAVRWQAEIVGERLGVKARPVIAIHCDSPAGAPRFSRQGVRRGGARIILAGDLTRRLERGRRRLRRGDVQSLAGDVLEHFRPASASARQNWVRD